MRQTVRTLLSAVASMAVAATTLTFAAAPNASALADDQRIFTFQYMNGPGEVTNLPAGLDAATITSVQVVRNAPGGPGGCLLTTAGSVWCWGSAGDSDASFLEYFSGGVTSLSLLGTSPFVIQNNQIKQGYLTTNDGVTFFADVLVIGAGELAPDDTIVELDTSFHVSCVRTGAGGTHPKSAFCWGDSTYGAVGNGSQNSNGRSPVLAPVLVSGITGNVIDISTGDDAACAVTDDGKAWCWGDNAFGQLGIPEGDASLACDEIVKTVRCAISPVDISGFGALAGKTVVTIATSRSDVGNTKSSSCAADNAGAIYCWGGIDSMRFKTDILGGAEGYGSRIPVAADVTALGGRKVEQLIGDSSAWCAQTGTQWYCWGWNPELCTGNNRFTKIQVPTKLFSHSVPVESVGVGQNAWAWLTTTGGNTTESCSGGGGGGGGGDGGTGGAGVPSEVQNVEVVARSKEATVSWSKPDDAGSSKITGYEVAADPSSKGCQTNASKTSCTVTGLTNGTEYVFEVVAKNASGSSEPVRSYAVTPGASQTPTPPRVVASPKNNALEIRWSPSKSAGSSKITAYRIVAMPGGKDCEVKAVAGKKNYSCTISGLTNGDEYTLNSYAKNSEGWSAKGVFGPAVPGTRPSKPLNLTVVSKSKDGTLKISWKAPSSNGGMPITGYVVFWRLEDGNKLTTMPSVTTLERTITGLKPGARYRVSVAAVNKAGRGLTTFLSRLYMPK